MRSVSLEFLRGERAPAAGCARARSARPWRVCSEKGCLWHGLESPDRLPSSPDTRAEPFPPRHMCPDFTAASTGSAWWFITGTGTLGFPAEPFWGLFPGCGDPAAGLPPISLFHLRGEWQKSSSFCLSQQSPSSSVPAEPFPRCS